MMEDIILRYGEKLGIFALAVYIIWTDHKEKVLLYSKLGQTKEKDDVAK